MKKITLLAFLILPLGGCSLKQPDATNSSTRSIDKTESSKSQNVQINLANQVNLNNYEEATKITTIFTPNNFKVTKLVDNSEKRVFLFSKNNQKFYKSIFVKSTQFLKVVDLRNNETEIFNGFI